MRREGVSKRMQHVLEGTNRGMSAMLFEGECVPLAVQCDRWARLGIDDLRPLAPV